MVKDCAVVTDGRFKLVHAFYIGMLAVRYRTPQGEKVMWPNQYAWLLQQALIDWDDHASWGLSEENIRDKSNADGTAKLLAIGQVTWFMMQSIMRLARHLPLSQLEAMTLSYIPLIAITYFFWWVKPKDVMTPSVVNTPDMLQEQKTIFESMAVSSAFDRKQTENKDTFWTICYLTPRVFEKEAEMASKDNQRIALQQAEENIIRKFQKQIASQHIKQADGHMMEKSSSVTETSMANLPVAWKPLPKEIVLAYWDPDVYHSKILWPIMCLFGALFGAIHLIAWNTAFPTIAEEWLWRIAGLVSVFSMLIFMQFEKVVLRWGGPLTIISLVSPVVYLVSRIIMLGGVIAAFRASDPAIYETYSISTYWIHIL